MKKLKTKKLLIMALLHFIAMYFLMYSMVDVFDNVFLNLNNFYMATIMTSPMLIIEIIMMGQMYENKKLLKVILLTGIVFFIIGFTFIRRQTLIYDNEFIRSMIPHHAGAILMCKKSNLEDEELKRLCEEIITSQQSEIDKMNDIYSRLSKE